MIKLSTKTHVPHLKIHTPNDRKFWKAMGIELAKDIVKRTQSGKDADDHVFESYKKSTAGARRRKKRSAKVNLTDTGRMLASVPRGVRSRKNGLKITLAGESGKKAYYIQETMESKRTFFEFNDKQVERSIKKIIAWMKRKNK